MGQRLAVRDAEVSWTPTDDGQVVVLDLRTSRYLSVNRSAALLWTRLSEGTTEPELVGTLVDTYGISDSAARHDVAAFLAVLRERDLLAD